MMAIVEADLDVLFLGRRHVASDVIGTDRQFTVTAVELVADRCPSETSRLKTRVVDLSPSAPSSSALPPAAAPESVAPPPAKPMATKPGCAAAYAIDVSVPPRTVRTEMTSLSSENHSTRREPLTV